MEDYNKIIESISIKFKKAKNVEILHPFVVENFYDIENSIFLLHGGEIAINEQVIATTKGDILFLPSAKAVKIRYGKNNEELIKLNHEEFITKKEKYLETQRNPDPLESSPQSFSYINFEAKIFDAANFFSSLDIPPFIIKNHHTLPQLIQESVTEELSNYAGKERMIQLKTELVVVEILRHILHNNLFVEKIATNSAYFKDPRLIEIFNYIKQYLNGDLSNKVLASVANVSEDYVGQYFKMLTGINPQDYIEYQRMEIAVNLLRTSKKSIREIGVMVGYKDTAYFCRRFKMMFGIPAGKMRKREVLVNN